VPKTTLESIAKVFDVSAVAVWKALNNKKGVSEQMREKIKTYAKSVGYINSKSIINAKNKKFLFLINKDFFLTPSEQYYSTIFYSLSYECSKSGSLLQMVFIETENTLDKINRSIRSFRPDGIFIAGEISQNISNYLMEQDVCIVHIDYFSPYQKFNAVYVNNYVMSYCLTKYLTSKGHKKIGFVGNIDKTSAIADRFFGYLKALNEEGLEFSYKWHIKNNLVNNDDITNLYFPEALSAYVCHCDAAAQRMYTALALKGLRVPEDVSIISFDNTPLCESIIPNLTSAGPQKDYYAKKAFNTMIDSLNNKNKLFQVIIKTKLAERDSVRDLTSNS